MARNIEIKTRIEDVDSVLAKVMSIADEGPSDIHQDDIFFSCQHPNGRLKLRIFSPTEGQLIFYQRPDSAATPQESRYVIVPTSCPNLLLEALTLSCGQVGRVQKSRKVFLVGGRTRVHFDRIVGLTGNYLELEVVLADDEPSEAGVVVANELLVRLGLSKSDLIGEAYVDLLARERP